MNEKEAVPQTTITRSDSDRDSYSLGQRYLKLLFQVVRSLSPFLGLNSIESVLRFAVSNQARRPSAPRAKGKNANMIRTVPGVKELASLNAPDCNPPHRRCRTEIVVLWSLGQNQ